MMHGISVVIADAVTDKLDKGIASVFEVTVNFKKFSETFGFPPSLMINEGSKCQDPSILMLPFAKSLFHCWRRLRPLGAA